VRQIAIPTPQGEARAHILSATGAAAGAALVLGHGAGGGIAARDLQAAGQAAASEGLAVALVEQPYRVAGRRAPAPAPRLDGAWIAVLGRLQATELAGMALVVGGRSMGARVACRTADASGAVGVLCLAFPLKPPQRAGAARETPSRLPELEAVSVPTLVVQGTRDPFGMPPAGPTRTVVHVAGDHSLKADLAAVGAAVGGWLAELPGLVARR
jgi:predicted alpha/beta-hydrolase family hydrolase